MESKLSVDSVPEPDKECELNVPRISSHADGWIEFLLTRGDPNRACGCYRSLAFGRIRSADL